MFDVESGIVTLHCCVVKVLSDRSVALGFPVDEKFLQLQF